MSKLLALIPWWIYAAVLAAVLGAGGLFLYRAGENSVNVDFEAYKTSQAEARILADRAQQLETGRQQAAFDKEAQDAQSRIASLEADVVAAGESSDGLRAAVDSAAKRARANTCATGTSPSQPDSDPIGVLADVLARSSARSEIVERYADQVRIAADTCERSTDALQPPGGQAASGAKP
jgi:hypothetical protein